MHEDDEAREWDEYEWERFLQNQDQKADRFIELLEKYMDHPERDRMIAKEMGWQHLLDDNGKLVSEEGFGMILPVDEAFLEELSDEEEEEDESEDDGDHPLHRAAYTLTMWVLDYFENNPKLQQNPSAMELASHCATASAKLAAALGESDDSENGLTLAYLKRALKAITGALDCFLALRGTSGLGQRSGVALQRRLFEVRDGIITLMGDIRRQPPEQSDPDGLG